MSARRRAQPGRVRSRREVLAAVGASAAVIVATAFLVWVIRPRDGGPDITDISDTPTSTVVLPDDTGIVPTTAPAAPASTAPPASSTAPAPQP